MERFAEIAFLRGIAIVLMAIFHVFFDLRFFGLIGSGPPNIYWRVSAGIIASIFLSLVGISLSISHARAKKRLSRRGVLKKYLLRGFGVFFLAMLVTAATWIYPHEGFIVFGVLHLIGLGILISIPFLEHGELGLGVGVGAFLVGLLLAGKRFSFPWLLWLGFTPRGFYSLDYYPLLPWLGIILMGLYLGKRLYPNGKRAFRGPGIVKWKVSKPLSFLGRHSLKIYLLHQPVIVLLILAFRQLA